MTASLVEHDLVRVSLADFVAVEDGDHSVLDRCRGPVLAGQARYAAHMSLIRELWPLLNSV